MRALTLALVLAAVYIAVAPAFAAPVASPDLTISLFPDSGSFDLTGAIPDPGDCLSEYCVLYTGTLTDNDTDDSIMSLGPASVSFTTTPATGSLTLDNTFDNDVPGILIGDPTFVYPSSFPYYQYSGPIFGIDVAPGTSVGTYDGSLSILTSGGTNDTGAGETFTANFTVVVVPEPSTLTLFAGILILMGWLGVRRAWRSSEASR